MQLKKRRGPTLFEREMADPEFAKLVQAEREAIASEVEARESAENQPNYP